jgi:colanic acid biosynthesis glycosyl transferase WcaI
MAEVGNYLRAADCLLVNLKSDPLFSITIPSKTQAYLAAGKPIIMAVEGDAADMVREAGAGICISPDNAEELAQAMIAMSKSSPHELRKMGDSGKCYYDEFLSIDVGVSAFQSVFTKVSRLGWRQEFKGHL